MKRLICGSCDCPLSLFGEVEVLACEGKTTKNRQPDKDFWKIWNSLDKTRQDILIEGAIIKREDFTNEGNT